MAPCGRSQGGLHGRHPGRCSAARQSVSMSWSPVGSFIHGRRVTVIRLLLSNRVIEYQLWRPSRRSAATTPEAER